MKDIKRFVGVLVFVFFIFSCGLTWSEVEIMPVDQIKPGMIGKGYTVFKSPEISEFKAEILDILKNIILPGKDIIIAKLESPELEGYGGVVAGMSGSPVYIDGKLIGAIAYGWGPFCLEHIAGITPISYMINVLNTPNSDKDISSKNDDIKLFKRLIAHKFQKEKEEDIFQIVPEGFFKNPLTENSNLRLLPIPVFTSGLNVIGNKTIEGYFNLMGMNLIPAGTSKALEFDDSALVPGAPLGIQFVGGDLSLDGVGTLTYRDGNKIAAFGHSAFASGTSVLPMTSSKIITIIKSILSPYKFGVSTKVIGTIVQDRETAVAGRIGQIPPIVPMKMNMKDMNGKEKSFNFDILTDKILTPRLAMICIYYSISSENWSYGDMTLDTNVNIKIQDCEPLTFKELYSGMDSAMHCADDLNAIMSIFSMNPFKKVKFENIDVKVEVTDELQSAEILSLSIDKKEVKPGEEVRGVITIKPTLEDTKRISFAVKIPENLKKSVVNLRVCDGRTADFIEFQNNPGKFYPEDFDSLYKLFSELKSNRNIIVEITDFNAQGSLHGKELQSAPNSFLKVINSKKSTGRTAPSFEQIIYSDKLETEYQMVGFKTVNLKISDKIL